jgi:transposase-like protein
VADNRNPTPSVRCPMCLSRSDHIEWLKEHHLDVYHCPGCRTQFTVPRGQSAGVSSEAASLDHADDRPEPSRPTKNKK